MIEQPRFVLMILAIIVIVLGFVLLMLPKQSTATIAFQCPGEQAETYNFSYSHDTASLYSYKATVKGVPIGFGFDEKHNMVGGNFTGLCPNMGSNALVEVDAKQGEGETIIMDNTYGPYKMSLQFVAN